MRLFRDGRRAAELERLDNVPTQPCKKPGRDEDTYRLNTRDQLFQRGTCKQPQNWKEENALGQHFVAKISLHEVVVSNSIT